MSSIVFLGYAGVCYLAFFATFLYSIGFLANWVVPRSIDAGGPASPLGAALLANVGLLSIFALQHSAMARQGFKRWWTRIVPPPIERATYVLLSCAALALLYWQWRPMPGVVWEIEAPWARAAAHSVYLLAGWGGVLYVSVLIDHFDLFGVRQALLHWRGRERPPMRFVTPALYRWVRHPLYVAWFVVFWATPTMTVGRLLFAVVATGYILLAVQLEERDLIAEFGDRYRRYRRGTPAFVPKPGRGRSAAAEAAS
jgi:protein-S-isoprenylcysteine O-methyltransferase Ste14